jgi:hypothetical protein
MNTVQLTSTDTGTSQRSAGGSLLARLDRPMATGLIAFTAWLAFVLARWQTWAHGQITLFIMSGVKYSHPAQMSPPISHVPRAGYDGQFYYRLALNPFNWHQTAYGITMDHNYRYTRIGYPLLAWIGSLGQHQLVPTVLVVINVICVGIIGWLGGQFARESGRHALWGLLFVAYFGLVISVGRDMSEPLADACMLGGLLAYRHSRYVLAALLVTYGVLTNEPILVLAIAIALTRLYAMYRRRARPGAPDLVWVLPGVAYLALQGIEHVVVQGKTGGSADVAANLTLPFKAMVPALVHDVHEMSWTHLGMYDINLIEFIALATVVAAGLLVLRSTTAPVHERVAFVGFVLVELVIASGQFWNSVFGDGRTYIDAYLLAVIMLLATPSAAMATSSAGNARKPGLLAGRVFADNRVITSKQLGWLAAVAVAALIVVARRRILFQ